MWRKVLYRHLFDWKRGTLLIWARRLGLESWVKTRDTCIQGRVAYEAWSGAWWLVDTSIQMTVVLEREQWKILKNLLLVPFSVPRVSKSFMSSECSESSPAGMTQTIFNSSMLLFWLSSNRTLSIDQCACIPTHYSVSLCSRRQQFS